MAFKVNGCSKGTFFNPRVFIIFLFLHENIWCGYSLEVPHKYLARRDYVPGELMLSPRHWRRRLSASMSASTLAQCLSFQMCA